MTKQLPYPELLRMSAEVLRANGMSAAHAATVAEGLGWADLRGIDSHGVAWLPRYVQLIRSGAINARAAPQVSRPAGARVSVEGHSCHGAVAMMRAVESAVAAAAEEGVCVATVRNTTHTGAVGRYAEWAAQRGCAALVLVAGPPLMAYHGARVPSLSTSPLTIAVPGAQEPLLLDMATSVVSFGRLRQAAARSETIPAGWALDGEGRPATDGTRAVIPLPLGGAKGAGLALMSELLTGVLLGSPVLQDYLAPEGKRRHQQNALLLLLQVGAFRAPGEFAHDAGALGALIKALPRAEGIDEIRLPGERGARTARERRAQGVPIPLALARELAALCKAAAVSVPTPLQEDEVS